MGERHLDAETDESRRERVRMRPLETSGDDAESSLDDAVDAAELLAAQLRDLRDRGLKNPAVSADVALRLRSLELSHRSYRILRERLSEAMEGVSGDALGDLVVLLEAWNEHPNDLLLVMKLSEQSKEIAAAIGALRTVRHVLGDDVGGESQ